MTLEEVYFVAGIITGLGVIVSLVFVGLQIREQVRESRLAANFLASTEVRNVLIRRANDDWYLELREKASGGLAGLTPVETSRFVLHSGATMRLFEALYYQNRDGRLDDWLWQSIQLPFKQTVSHPAFRSYWQALGENFTQDFQEHVADLGRTITKSLYDDLNDQNIQDVTNTTEQDKSH